LGQAAPAGQQGNKHFVQSGETPAKIALFYTGTTDISELIKSNPQLKKRLEKGILYAKKDVLTLPPSWFGPDGRSIRVIAETMPKT
jgi:hypothetical protein